MIIDLFHDTACPWCRIGHQHLKLALQEWEGEPVEVNYRTFFLNDAIPSEGHEFKTYMRAKGGGQIPLEDFFDAPRRMGSACGLDFNFEQIERAPNTMLSHRLIALAPQSQKEGLVEDIYAAYFEHGKDIGELQVLLSIAEKHGLDREEMREQLEGDVGREQVLAENRWARQNGIRGVPFFVFNQRFAVSGAQPPEALLQVMRETLEEQGKVG